MTCGLFDECVYVLRLVSYEWMFKIYDFLSLIRNFVLFIAGIYDFLSWSKEAGKIYY